MKKIEAIIEPFKLDEIKRALENEKIQRITIFEVKGAGSQRGRLKQYRGVQYIEDVPEIKVEVIVDDDEAEHVADAIVGALWSGDLSGGEVAILPIEKMTRVRIGQRGASRFNWGDASPATYLMKSRINLRPRWKNLKEKICKS